MIRKLKSGEYRLYSRKKGEDGKRRNLGTFSSRAGQRVLIETVRQQLEQKIAS